MGAPGFAGYQATPMGGVASASVTFTIPKVSCSRPEKIAGSIFDAGLLTASEDVSALIAIRCSLTGTTYSYAVQTPASLNEQAGAAPGDTVVVSMSESGSQSWAKVHDLTNGEYWFSDDAADPGDATINVGVVDLSSIPSFAPFTLSNATVNGDFLGFEGAQQFNAVNTGGGTVLVKSGKLKTTAGGSVFSVTFEHAG
jgi:hypothetical protein